MIGRFAKVTVRLGFPPCASVVCWPTYEEVDIRLRILVAPPAVFTMADQINPVANLLADFSIRVAGIAG